ncbi:Arsenate reductase [gamma proteobacterium HdN1]|nr:Arsenate reductase [gamma proteobacterium HdN1]
MPTTIYHNPRCSKSRETLALLQQHGVTPDVVLYLENPPSRTRLKELLKALGMKSRDILRTKEKEYEDLGLADAKLSETALLDAIAAHPRLLERPIVVVGERAVIGRPPENVLALLGDAKPS